MNAEDFAPTTEIEHKLVDAQEGRLSSEEFMQELLDATMFLPVHDDSVSGIQLSDKARPISIQLVEHAGTGVGISINLGWDFGLDIEPKIVAQLSQQ